MDSNLVVVMQERDGSETQEDFRKRVQEFYAYQFKPGERWTLYGGKLIVAHPEREPIMIHEDGKIEVIRPWHG